MRCAAHPKYRVDDCPVCERRIADVEFPAPDQDPTGEMADHEAAREQDMLRRQWP